jgi:catalase
MPLATTQKPKKPEIQKSPPLSLMALPGDGGVATRKVAIMIAEGIDSVSVNSIQAALTKAGAVTRYVGTRLGSVTGATGVAVEADATLENSPAVLFDGLVLPDGAQALVNSGQAVEFLKDQFKHCKTILVLGGASALLEKAGIPFDAPDAGLIFAEAGSEPKAFIAALAKHRHVERDRDAPIV